jgi:hypothetical protein
LAGQILAAALEERRAGESGRAAARRVAGRIGAELGEALRDRLSRRADYPLGLAEEAVRELGYEPRRDGDRLDLRNCPFDELAESHRELICPMNQALLAGLLSALGAAGVSADDPAAASLLRAVAPGGLKRPGESAGRRGHRPGGSAPSRRPASRSNMRPRSASSL